MDDRVRAAEREAAAVGTPEAQAEVLRQRLRCGSLTQENLDLLVWADHEPAWIVQDYWIHSDHIPGICPCPGCWKGGGDDDWATEIKRRWGAEADLAAIVGVLERLFGNKTQRSIRISRYGAANYQSWGGFWTTTFDMSKYPFEIIAELRKAAEKALVEFALNA